MDLDGENWGDTTSSRRFIQNVLGDSGWDRPESHGSSLCSGVASLRHAAQFLLSRLNSGEYQIHTDEDILALARQSHKTWSEYVDPALSRGLRSGAGKPLVVLYECGTHICTLVRPGPRDEWEMYWGQEAMYALLHSDEWESDEDEVEPDQNEPESFDTGHISDDLTAEDEELRDLRMRLLGDPEFGACTWHGMENCPACQEQRPTIDVHARCEWHGLEACPACSNL